MDNGRKSYRLKEWDYRTPWWYFVTICTDEHIHYSGDVVNEKMKLNKIGKIARIEWLKIEVIRDNVELDEFMIMPNHIHGIIIINKMYDDAVNGNIHRVKTKNYFSNISPKSGSLSAIVRSFKSAVTKNLHIEKIEFK